MFVRAAPFLLLPFIVTVSYSEDPPADRSAVVLREMQRRVETLSVSLTLGDAQTPCTFVEEPLLRYTDPARETVDGTLWLWTHEGRPAALLCLFTFPRGRKGWNYEWTSFSEQPLRVSGRSSWEWTPVAADRKWLSVGDTDPAALPTARLLQMKRIARGFIARETLRGEPYTLRLLERPLHRYTAPKEGVIDGALFACSYGTNPEIVMQIECHKTDDDGPQWRIAFARTSSAYVKVLDGDKEIWSQPETHLFEPRDPYYGVFESDAVNE